jgi:hypothetical protein
VDLFDDFFTKATPKKPQIKQSPQKPSTTTVSNDPFPDFSSPAKPSPKKRPRQKSPTPEPEEDFAPAATEMRARLAKTKTSQHPESDSDLPANDPKTKPTKGKKRPVEEDDEVLSAARERKRVALETSRQAAEELAAAVKDHAHLKNLGEVELFQVDLSASRPVDRKDRSARWDPAWNGRKNFKKFRRANQSVSVGVGRAMIQLVEYKGKSAASQGNLFPLGSGKLTVKNSFSRRRRWREEEERSRRRMILHWR